jgi:glycosyltransferase 2 family protein
LGLLVSLILLFWCFKDISFYQIWQNIREVNCYYLVASGSLVVAEFLIRALRWKYLLTPGIDAKFDRLFSVLMIGYFSNNIVPGRIGDLIRAQCLGATYNLSRVQALATIVVERIADVLMLLSFFGICLLLYPFPSWIKQAGILTALSFLATLAILYIYGLRQVRIVTLVQNHIKGGWLAEKLTAMMENFGKGLCVLTDTRAIALVILYSALIWALIAVSIHMVLLAFSLRLPLFAAVFIAVTLGLGMMIPASPASVGVYEGFGMLPLVALGVDGSVALSFSIVLHSVELAITTSIGFVCFLLNINAFSEGTLSVWPSGAKLIRRT